MTEDERARHALTSSRLPKGFCRRILRLPPGLELGLERIWARDAIVLVEQGELELEYPAGARGRFGRGSMVPIGPPPVAFLRSVGLDALVVVVVSRQPARATDEFFHHPGSQVRESDLGR
jgi:hypothetical protein